VPTASIISPKVEQVVRPSIEDFRSSLVVISSQPGSLKNEIYTYWNNHYLADWPRNAEEILHIVQEADELFYLEIGNLVHRGSLRELEQILYEWAMDEGWLDVPRAEAL
jgi:hypothetical protein